MSRAGGDEQEGAAASGPRTAPAGPRQGDRAGGGGGGGGGHDEDDGLFRRKPYLKGRPRTFRALTSLDVGEARDLYRQAASIAAAQADRDGGRLGGGSGAARAPREFPPIEDFLLALMLVRHPDIDIVDGMFDVPDGASQAALDAVLPFLFEIRDMPWRFAHRLVPLGYRMPASLKRSSGRGRESKRGRGSGSILDYM